ncbi:MAG: demethylmenaquinone methyltransferase-like protein [Chitinophagaceae bacterium]|nr:demethylmenaquinone methyltransferase-like protein [Chitinophagaceae bacterium]MDB5221384.1 demethylmenaquinone methyltransferase-like protein [Chitinophagaceae bacterium]
MNKRNLLIIILIISGFITHAQRLGSSPEYIKTLTYLWKGERSADGRPKVSDQLLERLKNVTLEEAWGVLRRKGYVNQYEGDWIVIQPDSVMTGRVVTAQYMPARPDLDSVVVEQGKAENRSQKGSRNLWPVDVLSNGDVYVADSYGKVADGTLIGSSLGNAIYGRSKRGVIFYGSVRDMQELSATKGFNGWVKGHDPSAISQMEITSINAPVRIGRATVLPGDVVLANKFGTIFIPAHLVEELVISSEVTAIRDEFERVRLQEGKYLTGEIHGKWSDTIKKDFRTWLNDYQGKLPMSRKELDEYLKAHDY